MNTIVPAIPAQIVVSQAEVKLVADETANADAATLKADQQRIEAAQQVVAAASRSVAVDFVT
jgi:hypothetical protein